MILVLACIAVYFASVGIAFAHARYARARDLDRAHAAARWDVVSWGAAVIGFVIAVKMSMWALPFEATGLYTGTYVVVERSRRARSEPEVKRKVAE